MWGAIARGVGGALIGEVAVNLALNTKGFKKDVNNTIKGTEKSFGSAFGKIGKMAAAAFSAKVVYDFAKASVQAASEAQSAWTGLYSIVNGTGKSFANAKGFIEEYISDGLVPLSNATTAYKNLAARGYSTEQIEKVMTALKDAAAFGRQSSYSLGDAITSATEGLKNENSILVDNAGVTKNVAKMWEEYAESIGTTANNLTQDQKIQAEVNGIMKETAFQTGDAATYTNTFAGRTAQLSTAFLNLKTAVGRVVAPIASTFIPIIVTAMNALTKFFNKIQQVLSVFGFKWQDVVTKSAASGIENIGTSASNTADSIGSIGDSASSTAKKLKRALGGMDELNILNFNDDSNKSSGSGSGADGTSGIGDSGVSSMFDNTITEDPISPQIQKIADKIKSYLEPLQKINLDNLSKAFDKLKTSLKPITKKLLEGLDWLWFNILVPIAKWTIEDAIPAFINTLAGSLDFLNGVMDVAKPFLQYLWEEFLRPIASWTGGIIVDVLNDIGDGLSKVGKWLSNVAPSIETVRQNLDPFTNLLKNLGEYLGALYNKLKPTIDLIGGQLANNWNNYLKPILMFVFEQVWDRFKNTASILGGILEVLTGITSLDFQKVKKGIDGIWTSMKKQFIDTMDNWKEFGKNFIEGIGKGISESLGNAAEWVRKAIFDPIVKAFKSLFGIHSPSTVFASLGTELLNGLKQPFLSIGTWISDIKNKIVNGLSGLWSKGKEKGAELYNGLSSGVGNLKTWASNKMTEITNGFSGLWSTFKSKGAEMYNGLTSGIGNVKSWASGKLTDIKNGFSGALSTFKGIGENMWTGLKNAFSSKKLNLNVTYDTNVGSVKQAVYKALGLKGWPKLSFLAQGGWVAANNPQLAVIGDNKREGEIVAPESKIRDQVKQAINEMGGTGTQQLEITIYHKYEDGRTVIQKINQAQIDAGEVLLLT